MRLAGTAAAQIRAGRTHRALVRCDQGRPAMTPNINSHRSRRVPASCGTMTCMRATYISKSSSHVLVVSHAADKNNHCAPVYPAHMHAQIHVVHTLQMPQFRAVQFDQRRLNNVVQRTRKASFHKPDRQEERLP